jgi:CRP-like cAMP-binding protein
MASEPRDDRDDPSTSPDAVRALDALGQELREGPTPDLATRIQLADLLLAAGREDEAVQAFLRLADELAKAGQLARAFGLLKRVEALRPDDNAVAERLTHLVLEQQRLFSAASDRLEAVPLAVAAESVEAQPARPASPGGRPLAPLTDVLSEVEALLDAQELMVAAVDDADGSRSDRPAGPPAATSSSSAAHELSLLDLVQETLRRPLTPDPRPPVTLGHRLLAAPLFADLTREELADVIRRLRLRSYRSGDILMTEGERGQNLAILTSGQVKVYVRSPTGRDVQVARFAEGDFFGEVSAISGSRRTATIVASSPCETLELAKEDLDGIARAHPRVRDRLDEAFVQRAGSQAAAVVREIDITAQGHVHDQADLALTTRFGRSSWDPRMRLRLASALIHAGHEDEALPILAEAAAALLRAGRTSGATLLLKKIEGVHFRDVTEVHLAPLRRALEESPASQGSGPRASAARPTDPVFQRWLIHVAREAVARRGGGAPAASPAADHEPTLAYYGPGLRASPLFESLADDELLALVRELRLVSVEPGGVVLTQGEQGESLFVLVIGAVKIWVRDANDHNVRVCQLEEGAFFGEIATLSGHPRSASVTAAEHCVLLEVNRESLASIRAQHPHVGAVLEAQFLSRLGPQSTA